MPEFNINLTDLAAEQLKKHLDSEFTDPNERAVSGIRLLVTPGGCSGFSYGIESTLTSDEKWCVIEVHGVKLFIDPFSEQYLNGITIDYVTGLMGTGFTFSNPNATGSCGCGTSFSV